MNKLILWIKIVWGREVMICHQKAKTYGGLGRGVGILIKWKYFGMGFLKWLS